MINLKQARERGKLEEFVSEREAEAKAVGDRKAFDETVAAMAGRPTSRSPRDFDGMMISASFQRLTHFRKFSPRSWTE